MPDTIQTRLEGLDWDDLTRRLDADGFVQTPPVLTAAERAELERSFEDGSFRATIDMRRHRFGEGTYRYFDRPLPGVIDSARHALYPPLAGLANRWAQRLGEPDRYPADLDAFLERCHGAGQERPTPLILRYTEGGHNALHQDIYGEVAFPLQAVTLLSAIGDFAGGQFVLVEGRPRQQSRAHVIDLDPGAFLIFPTRQRPVQGTRGSYRAAMRHGVATVLGGERTTLGIIFHDAA
ncbi:MAG TPA: 2OG-Fe(II) oxygenase [Gaiellales bacterium]|jgi:hypothetical protein